MCEMKPVFLCCDLDRTVLPNGTAPESVLARPLLRALASLPQVRLAYVSGRHLALLEQAIVEFDIPVPDYAVADVGTSIYLATSTGWRKWEAWDEEIGADWGGRSRLDLARMLGGIEGLLPQEEAKQGRHKLSYYAAPAHRARLLASVEGRLAAGGIDANLIWSVDDLSGEGLLDILPASASKLHAVRFLMQQHGHAEARTVFAGDSGNDLPVLTSGLQAVLVRNAAPEVREEARRAIEPEYLDCLYFAQGGFLGMNGNYTAGVLEGLAHFLPEIEVELQAAMRRLAGNGKPELP